MGLIWLLVLVIYGPVCGHSVPELQWWLLLPLFVGDSVLDKKADKK